MTATLPSHAAIVVIGAGVVGTSIAWHLAQRGERDVVLIERSKIGSGTSWHAAGNMETYRSDPLILEMIRYAVDLFPRLEAETGISFGWRQSGRVQFTVDPERFAAFRAIPARSRARGIEVELLSPREVGEKLPIVNTDDLLGGLWIPSDGRVDPTGLATAFARGAARGGVRVIEDLGVQRILEEGGRIVGVETAQGSIACEQVVLAAGLWSARLAATCGIALPQLALHHFYLLTKPIEGLSRDLPLFISYDERLYGREDVGGLLVGVFDENAIPVTPEELPGDFAFSLLPENWEQIQPNLPTLMHRFPILERSEIRMLLNGPESFTPDMQMMLGRPPGIRGLMVASAMNSNGIAMSSYTGRFVAEWLLDGRPGLDIGPLDLRRFAGFESSPSYLRRRIAEVPVAMCRTEAPGRGFATGRGLRRSPFQAALAAAGAVFESICGWEVPAWFGAERDWATAAEAEIEAAERSCAIVDRSADAKLWLEGPDARALLQRLTGLSVLESVAEAPMPDAQGCVQVLPRLFPMGPRSWLLTADVASADRLQAWVREAIGPDEAVAAVDVTSGWAALDLIGPGTARLLEPFGLLPASTGRIGPADMEGIPALLAGLPVWDCQRLLIPSEWASDLIECLEERAGSLSFAGRIAAETLRVARAVQGFGTETGPSISTDGERRVQRFTLAATEPDSLAKEPILVDGRYVGHVTSGCWLPTSTGRFLFGLVEAGTPATGCSVLLGGSQRALLPA
jgi:4-methylaminobutanoate oxidase (formaldehyde-forming)